MSDPKTYIDEMLQIPGAGAALIIDANSGMALATGGDAPFDLEIGAPAAINIVRAAARTASESHLTARLEQMVGVHDTFTVIIHLLHEANEGIAAMVVLDSNANMAMANHKLKQVEKHLVI